MEKRNFIHAGVALSVLGFVAVAQAQTNNTNPNLDTSMDGVVIMEEDIVAVPAADMSTENNRYSDMSNHNTRPNADSRVLNQDTRRGMNNPSAGSNNVPSSDFNRNVNNMNPATPDNQPMVDKALKNQNPTYNKNMSY